MTARKLAIQGGAPIFSAPLHVGKPVLPDRKAFLGRIEAMLDRAWLTNNGPMVLEFESRVASLLGVRNCITVANATLGLELVIRALGLKGEVIVPSFTFIASAHVLAWHGITPVFCDVDPRTHQLDVAEAEHLITSKTTAILAVDLWGLTPDIAALQALCTRKSLQLVFDSAHAFGCSHGDTPIGSFGRAEVFSFHATKFFNTLEGGAITTNDDVLADKLRLLRNFGFAGFDNVVSEGTNAKMNEVSAAMGLSLLERWDAIFAHNQAIHAAYTRQLSKRSGVSVLQYPPENRSNHQYLVTEISTERFGLSRDHLLRFLESENVRARRYFYPGCHRSAPYRDQPTRRPLPVTEALCERVLCLPAGAAVDGAQLEKVCALVQEAQARAPEIARFFAEPEK